MIRPMVPSLTQSQIHCLVTVGLATIDGGTLAAFINMGVCINEPLHSGGLGSRLLSKLSLYLPAPLIIFLMLPKLIFNAP